MPKFFVHMSIFSLIFVSGFALGGSPDLIQRGLERAVAGEVLLSTAQQCGWVKDDAEFKTARNVSLQSAVIDLDVTSRILVVAKLVGHHPDWMQFAKSEAQARVAKGACTDNATRTTWETLRSTPPPLGSSNRGQ